MEVEVEVEVESLLSFTPPNHVCLENITEFVFNSA
jgi:hypothetical protein